MLLGYYVQIMHAYKHMINLSYDAYFRILLFWVIFAGKWVPNKKSWPTTLSGHFGPTIIPNYVSEIKNYIIFKHEPSP